MSASRRVGLRALVLLAGLLLLAAALRSAPRDPRPRALARLFGPLADLAASWQWARADGAFRAGAVELGIARAERALEIDPGATGIWEALAWQAALEQGSVERELDVGARARWLETGLATLARGERVAREPAELAFCAGLILRVKLEFDAELAARDGERLRELARESFARAARLGHPDAAALAD
jgi:hypothetical protein